MRCGGLALLPSKLAAMLRPPGLMRESKAVVDVVSEPAGLPACLHACRPARLPACCSQGSGKRRGGHSVKRLAGRPAGGITAMQCNWLVQAQAQGPGLGQARGSVAGRWPVAGTGTLCGNKGCYVSALKGGSRASKAAGQG